MPTRAIAADELLAQMGWVQALARTLVRDPNVAADVAQQTWLLALERPPHTATSGPGLRAWLASVTRTLARQSVRSETRRHARERRAARVETVPGEAPDVVARAEVQREVVAAVMELDEPYRSTVLYRYLDGLSGPEIAARMDVSPAAVRKRLSRGLAALREGLDDQHEGDCRAWLSGLLPIGWAAEGAPAAEATRAGELVLPGSGWSLGPFGLAAGLTGVLAAVLWALEPWAGTLPGDPSVVVGADAPASLPAPAPLEREASRTLEAGDGSARPDAGLDASGWQRGFAWQPTVGDLSGRVIDTTGAAVPELRVRIEPPLSDDPRSAAGRTTRTTLADADGRFVFDAVAPGAGRVLAASGRWVTVFAGDAAGPGERVEPVVVVAPRRALGGRVLDDVGDPVVGARLALLPPDDLPARLGGLMESSWPLEVSARSDEQGRFHFARRPAIAGARLAIRAPGFRPLELAAPEHDEEQHVVVLERPGRALHGQVVDAREQPVPDALVAWLAGATTSDAAGRFTLWLDHELLAEAAPGTPAWLTAVAPGARPARVEADASGRFPEPLRLQLGDAPRSLAGQVLDPDGEPVPHARVWIDDPTLVVVHPSGEDGSLISSGTRPSGAPSLGGVVLAEAWLAGARPDRWWHVVTDVDGRFELVGLDDRPYTVAVCAGQGLARGRREDVHPDAGPLTLVLDGPRHPAPLVGRVLDAVGRGWPGVRIELQRATLSAGGTTWLQSGSTTTSDAEGRFVLEHASRDGTLLVLEAEGALPLRRPLTGGTGPLELVLPTRCDLRLLLADPGGAVAFAVEDRAGGRLDLVSLRRDRRQERERAPLWFGRSEVLSVPSSARRLVLLDAEGDVVGERPLALAPGPIHEIR